MKISKKILKQIIAEEFKNVLNEDAGEGVDDVVGRLLKMSPQRMQGAINDLLYMADGDTEFAHYYPHIRPEELPMFAQAVLDSLEKAQTEEMPRRPGAEEEEWQ